MKLALFLVAAACLGALLYVRLAPSDPDRWHVDPLMASDPGASGVRIAPGVITSGQSAEALLADFDRVAGGAPRTIRLAGSPAEGLITYVVRSKWIGFPDYLTVRAFPTEGGATLAVLSRARFGYSDVGVNAGRLKRLLAGLDVAMKEPF